MIIRGESMHGQALVPVGRPDRRTLGLIQAPRPHGPHRFTVELTQEGEAVRLVLSGDLDLASSPMLEQRIAEAEAYGRTILIDLALVTFIDSTGLHVFIRAVKRGTEVDRRVAFANCPTVVRRVFELTRTTHMLDGDSSPVADQSSPAVRIASDRDANGWPFPAS